MSPKLAFCTKFLSSKKAYMRKKAAKALGRLGDPMALPYLRSQLENETYPSVAEVISSAITKLESETTTSDPL